MAEGHARGPVLLSLSLWFLVHSCQAAVVKCPRQIPDFLKYFGHKYGLLGVRLFAVIFLGLISLENELFRSFLATPIQ